MKFVEAILSNNTTDDHCREFVTQKGLVPLMNILSLPNLPLDFPTTHSCQAVASVCKSILVRYLMFPLFSANFDLVIVIVVVSGMHHDLAIAIVYSQIC